MDNRTAISLYKLEPQGKYLLERPEHHVANCTTATDDFMSFIGRGWCLSVSQLLDRSKTHYYWSGAPIYHVAWTDKRVVIDWTFRQFDPEAACPLVEPYDMYKIRWATIYGLTSIALGRYPVGYFKGNTEHVLEWCMQ